MRGIGHQQLSIFKLEKGLTCGGTLRKKRKGRKARPLSTKEPLHVVFKINRRRLRFGNLRSPKNFALAKGVCQQYARKFFIKIEQVSIQGDHCHLLLRTSRRSNFHFFFRVVAGQIAQRLENEGLLKPVTDTPKGACKKGTGLWKYRPFSRVVRGWRAFKIVRDYIQLNEKEALGVIRFQSRRLRGLSSADWEILWR